MQTGAISVRQACRDAAMELKEAGVPEPNASAKILLAELLEVGRAEVLSNRGLLSEEQGALYGAWISRRKAREPVQRTVGVAYFRHLRLELTGETLIPRPDTESVVEAALETIDLRAGRCRVLDLGTGSGTIAISIAWERPLCEVHATDVSEAVLETARSNAEAAGTEVRFHRGDHFSGLEALQGKVSLLVSNPPYVKSEDLRHLAPEVRDWDPPTALDGGRDGLSFYRRIFAEARPLLEDGADVVLEIGDGQADAVLEMAREADFAPVGIRPDLTGAPRAVLLKWRE